MSHPNFVAYGHMVLYRFRPGQVRAGQPDAPALVTRVNPDGTANLTVYPDGTPDPLFLRAVPRLSQDVASHCWEMAKSDDASEQVSQLQRDLVDAHTRIDALDADVKALAKRREKLAGV